MRSEVLEVIALPGHRPLVLADGGCLGEFLDQGRGEAGRDRVVATDLAEVGLLGGTDPLLRGGLLEELGDPFVGREAVGEACQLRELATAVLESAGRHHGLAVPAEDARA